jgi:VWFA-related protein
MTRLTWSLGTAIFSIALHSAAQSPAPQPVFRGGTDLVQVDVSVLDSRRRAVRGLTAADFTVLEDGKPREIQAFTEVYLPGRLRAEAAPWVRDVPSDVVSNQATEDDGRLVIIVLDRSIPVGEPTITARRTASAVVNQLGPGDLAAVVSTSGGATHNFTSDRGRLLRAINESDVSAGSSLEAREIEERILGRASNPLNDGRCLCRLCVLETITRAADAVQATPRRRKVMFFIGSDLTFQSAGSALGAGADVGCDVLLEDAQHLLFNALDRANLTVHSIDPTGLATVGPIGRTSSTLRGSAAMGAQSREINEHLQRQGALRVLPERTGGRTVLNTNAPDLQVGDIFRESDSYYVIGFRPRDPDAKNSVHAITVKAHRSGLDVRARKSYTSAAAADVSTGVSTGERLSEPVRASLTGLLPANDIAIDLHAATFASPGSAKAWVSLAVGVSAFAPPTGKEATGSGQLEIVASAFDRGGRPIGVARQPLDVSWPAADAPEPRRFDVLSRLDLPPGDYEIRVAVHGTEPARTASVFSYVTVPAFDQAPLSLSSIVIGATRGTLTAPKDFLAAILPVVPTARRDFARADRLVAFLRIYQGTGRREPLLPVQLRAAVLDAQGTVVASEATALLSAQFDNARTADHYVALPLAGLAPGEYLLRIETEMGARTAGRALRFTVK